MSSLAQRASERLPEVEKVPLCVCEQQDFHRDRLSKAEPFSIQEGSGRAIDCAGPKYFCTAWRVLGLRRSTRLMSK